MYLLLGEVIKVLILLYSARIQKYFLVFALDLSILNISGILNFHYSQLPCVSQKSINLSLTFTCTDTHACTCTHRGPCTDTHRTNAHSHTCSTHAHTRASFSSPGKPFSVAFILKHTPKEPAWSPCSLPAATRPLPETAVLSPALLAGGLLFSVTSQISSPRCCYPHNLHVCICQRVQESPPARSSGPLIQFLACSDSLDIFILSLYDFISYLFLFKVILNCN